MKLKRLLACESQAAQGLGDRIADAMPLYAKNEGNKTTATEQEDTVDRYKLCKEENAISETERDNTVCISSDSDDFASSSSSTKVTQHRRLPKGAGEKPLKKSLVANNLGDDSQQFVSDAAVLLDLTRQIGVMNRIIIGMANGQTTRSQGRQLSKCGTQQHVISFPASEQARCALLHQPNPVIEISSDGDDSAFETEPVVGRHPQKAKGKISKNTGEISSETGGAAARDTLKAAQNMQEVFQLLQKLDYAVITDYNKLRDKGNLVHTYSMFLPHNAPTLEQANFYKTANLTTGSTKTAMDTIFEGVKANQGNMEILPVKPAVARDGTELRSILTYGTKYYKAYQKLCKGQAEDIIRGMFQNHKNKMEQILWQSQGAGTLHTT